MTRYLSSIVIVVTFAIAMLVLTVALHADNTTTLPTALHVAPAVQEKAEQPAHQVVCTPPSTAPTGMKPVYAQGSCTVTYYVPEIQQTICTTRQVGTDLRGKPVFRTTCTQHQ